MTSPHVELPAAFHAALRALRPDVIPRHLTLEEIRAPRSLTPYSAALAGEITQSRNEPGILADGSLTLLYTEEFQKDWGGHFRFAVIVRTTIDEVMGQDPLIYEVTRAWVRDSLSSTNAQYSHLRGTVTVLNQESFDETTNSEATSTLELRASWTPDALDPDAIYLEFKRHLESWMNLLFTTAGSPMLFVQR
ncbi:DUF3000 family protein [Populibacterium corticicola]|uniref:DUF3000 family protein n=1 Tax=Populibacterium corticicola TaxID=1812826 RepID=A0ABW5XC18_9MICO